jgi:hypothetical protein
VRGRGEIGKGEEDAHKSQVQPTDFYYFLTDWIARMIQTALD